MSVCAGTRRLLHVKISGRDLSPRSITVHLPEIPLCYRAAADRSYQSSRLGPHFFDGKRRFPKLSRAFLQRAAARYCPLTPRMDIYDCLVEEAGWSQRIVFRRLLNSVGFSVESRRDRLGDEDQAADFTPDTKHFRIANLMCWEKVLAIRSNSGQNGNVFS